MTNYSYFSNVAATPGNDDQRLRQIQNLGPGGVNISTHDYTYDAVGQILTWSKTNGATAPSDSGFTYDAAHQLIRASLGSNSSVADFSYSFDLAGNRKGEQIGTTVTASSFNSVNQLTGQGAGNDMVFTGTVNKPSLVTVGGSPATVDASNHWAGHAAVNVGANLIPLTAVDGNGDTTNKTISVTVSGGAARTLVFDANGNMTDNGAGQTYGWDAANRMVSIIQGSGVTGFVYDGLGRRTQETLNGAVIKQWIWTAGAQPVEERDAANNVTKRFFGSLGEQIAGANYFYCPDHLGSVREMTDATGAVRARYDYDPYGRITKLSGDLEADFGFTGFYRHQASGLNLTFYRAYDADLGHWLSRDPIEEEGGINLYAYVGNDPINGFDPLGLWVIALRLNFTATVLLGVNLTIALAFDDNGNIVVQKSGQPDLPGLKKLNAISIGPPLGAASASLTGGFSITNADTVCDQYGKTNAVGVYAGAGPAVEINGLWGKGNTDDGHGHYVGMDFGFGIGSPGVAAQGSITDTQEAYVWRRGR